MTLNKKHYDIIIVGSGMAGLYAAYNIKKMAPKCSFLVLEKYKKQWIGGRTSNEMFYGASVVTGAGIGRKDTNPLLLNLLKQLKIKHTTCTSIMDYSKVFPRTFDIMKIIDILKKEYKKKGPDFSRSLTFKEFSVKILGEPLYKEFVALTGYSDYENADVYETLYNYGMDDTKGGWQGFYLPYKKMVLALCEAIGYQHIKTSNNVEHIEKINDPNSPCLFQVKTSKDIVYYCNKVIIATTISSIQKLVPPSNVSALYSQIHAQPFLRLYGKFDKKSAEIMHEYVKHYTIVPGPLQKIISTDWKKGVFMISYSDNASALYLKKYLENTERNRNILCTMIENSLGIPKNSLHLIAIKDYFWQEGTHYYEPLKNELSREKFIEKVQHPQNNMLVIGEAVSTYQGWVEGALESVESAVTKKWVMQEC